MIVGMMYELIRGARNDARSSAVTEIRRELHATKGWRVISVMHGIVKGWIKPYQAVYKHTRRRRREPGLVPFGPKRMLIAQMRHRERRRDLQRDANRAKWPAEPRKGI